MVGEIKKIPIYRELLIIDMHQLSFGGRVHIKMYTNFFKFSVAIPNFHNI